MSRRNSLASRHPNGQIRKKSKTQRAKEAREVGVAARMRVHGLTEERASQEGAGSALGRIFNPRVDDRAGLYEAGKFFEESYRRYLRALESRPLVSSSDFDRTPGHGADIYDEDEHERKCGIAISNWKEIRHAVLTCGNPMSMMALEIVCIEDREVAPDGALGFALLEGLEAVAGVYSGTRHHA